MGLHSRSAHDVSLLMSRRLTGLAAVPRSPLVVRLDSVADEFQDAAIHYSKYSGRSRFLAAEARRAESQLRTVSAKVKAGEYSERQGYDWLRAAWRIINAIGRQNIT
jgi:hypothetical protein